MRPSLVTIKIEVMQACRFPYRPYRWLRKDCECNDYFVSSVKELATNFVTPSPSSTRDQFSFSEISQNEVTNILQSLNNSHARDIYGLNTLFLKNHSNNLVPLFQHFINRCVRLSFPTHWKTEQMKPIFKSDDPTMVSNFRPIAILPVMSTLLEKALS